MKPIGWASTSADLTTERYVADEMGTRFYSVPSEPTPIPPEGEGWRLVSAVADQGRVLFFWEQWGE